MNSIRKWSADLGTNWANWRPGKECKEEKAGALCISGCIYLPQRVYMLIFYLMYFLLEREISFWVLGRCNVLGRRAVRCLQQSHFKSGSQGCILIGCIDKCNVFQSVLPCSLKHSDTTNSAVWIYSACLVCSAVLCSGNQTMAQKS